MMDLTNKVTVITGAANGLGKALAEEFFQRGSHLALIDIDLPALQRLQTNLQAKGQNVTIHPADISIESEVRASRQQVSDQHQHIDILINNAGISISQPFEQLDLEDYKRLMDVNFWGTVYCSKYFLNDLKRSKDSRLVNIISDFALLGFPGKTTYGSSKSAVMGFTNALHTELYGSGTKVCMIIPPALNTGLVRNSKHIDESRKQKEAAFVEKNSMPLDRAAQKIIKQIRKGKFRIVIGSKMYWIDLFSRLFPTRMHRMISKNKKRFDFI